MTPEQMDTIDRLVAEHLFGWRWVTAASTRYSHYFTTPEIVSTYLHDHVFTSDSLPEKHTKGGGPKVPRYTRDGNAMLEVIGKMRADGWFVTLADQSPARCGRGNRRGNYYARFFIRRTDSGAWCGESAPLSVAIAALRAKGIEVPT